MLCTLDTTTAVFLRQHTEFLLIVACSLSCQNKLVIMNRNIHVAFRKILISNFWPADDHISPLFYTPATRILQTDGTAHNYRSLTIIPLARWKTLWHLPSSSTPAQTYLISFHLVSDIPGSPSLVPRSTLCDSAHLLWIFTYHALLYTTLRFHLPFLSTQCAFHQVSPPVLNMVLQQTQLDWKPVCLACRRKRQREEFD